jgi:hypothetical protein
MAGMAFIHLDVHPMLKVYLGVDIALKKSPLFVSLK